MESIAFQNGMIETGYDSTKINEETIRKILKDSIEKLGYKLLDE